MRVRLLKRLRRPRALAPSYRTEKLPSGHYMVLLGFGYQQYPLAVYNTLMEAIDGIYRFKRSDVLNRLERYKKIYGIFRKGYRYACKQE